MGKANTVLRSEGYNGLHHDLLNLLSLSSVRHSSKQYPDILDIVKLSAIVIGAVTKTSRWLLLFQWRRNSGNRMTQTK